MSRSFRVTVAIILMGFVVLCVFSTRPQISKKSIAMQNLGDARVLGVACLAFRDDNGGQWPTALDDLSADYIEGDWIGRLGFRRSEEEGREAWDYFVPVVPDPDPVEVLIRSPEPDDRYVALIYTDGSGELVKPRMLSKIKSK